MPKAVIYSKASCPFCIRAKELLSSQGVEFTEHLYGSAEFMTKEALAEKLGVSVNTVPQIVLDGKYIGGYTQLANHYGVAK